MRNTLLLLLLAVGCSFPTGDFQLGTPRPDVTSAPDAPDVPPALDAPDAQPLDAPDAVTDDVAPDLGDDASTADVQDAVAGDADDVGNPGDAPDAADVPVSDVEPDADAGDVTTGPVCGPDQFLCGETCASVLEDRANCGSCGRVCPEATLCVGGLCVSTCAVGQTACPDGDGGVRCVNLQSDGANCGMCGRTCTTGQNCAAGVCATACPAGQTACMGGDCANLMTDPANCGMCGRACVMGQTCTAGTCACPTGQTLCGSTCVNTATDGSNCGRCGTVCSSGQRCVSGACACPTGQSLCGGVCVSTGTDTSNCGMCGRACGPGQLCVAGACACPTGQTLCAGRCVDATVDRGNCGACGVACPAAQTCAGGRCVCPTGQTLCGAVCVDLRSSNSNCGACGTVCPTTMTCAAGRCACACAAGLSCCGTACVNFQTDNANCGTCGRACAAGTTCRAGVCTPLNDDRLAATALSLAAGETTVRGTTDGANFDGPADCASTPNVWYRFTIGLRELVYADTAGSSYDTRLYLVNGAGGFVGGTCNDDAGCSTGGFTSSLQSRFAVVLAPGTYYLAVAGYSSTSRGAYVLHVQHIPTNYGSVFFDAPIAGTATTPLRVLGGGSLRTPVCTVGPSGEDVRWFMTCGPGTPAVASTFSNCMADGATFVRASGGVFYDPAIYVYSGQTGAQVQCNDDGGQAFNCIGTGGDMAYYGSRISAPMPRGVNAVVVDERLRPSGLIYTLRYQLN